MDIKAGKNRGELPSYDDIFRIVENPSDVKDVPLKELYAFSGHPFKVLDDEAMMELAASIREQGIIIPILARPRKEGGYEIIYGHRRKRGAEIAGLTTAPVIVKKLNDKDATDIMVDSNIQRLGLFPSEKAHAYAMKYNQISKRGCRTDLHTGKVGMKLMQENEGESIRTIQRYISLTKLLPELLEFVDQKKLTFMVGVELSTLSPDQQDYLLQVILEKSIYPKKEEVEKLKEFAEKEELTKASVELILDRKKFSVKKITLKADRLQQYFPDNFSDEDKENIIYELLEKWRNMQGNMESGAQLEGQIDLEEWEDGKYLPK